MDRELYKNDNSVVRKDDLKYDGSNFIIPSYWVDTIADILCKVDENKITPDDLEDFKLLKDFFYDVQEYKNNGN
jgi:hypothetical protein